MNFHALLVVLLCAVAAFRMDAAEEATTNRFPLLAGLTLPEAILPPGCSISKGRPPIAGLQNRSITTNSQAFVFVDLLGTNVQAMYYAVYREKGELGIFGWAFQTEEAAKEGRDRLVAARGGRFRVWLCRNQVVAMWRDLGTTDECFHGFEEFIEKAIAAFATATR